MEWVRSGVVGIEAAPLSLVVARWPGGYEGIWANDEAGVAAVVAKVTALIPTLVVLDATGGAATEVIARLALAEIPLVLANARQLRAFALADGKPVTGGRVDARVLAQFGATVPLVPSPLAELQLQELAALLTWRTEVVAQLEGERTRRDAAPVLVAKRIEAHIDWLTGELGALDRRLRQWLEASPLWDATDRLPHPPSEVEPPPLIDTPARPVDVSAQLAAGPVQPAVVPAQPGGVRSRRGALKTTLAEASVVVIFVVVLVVGFGRDVSAKLRDGLGSPLAATATPSIDWTATPTPPSTPTVAPLSSNTPLEVGQPLLDLATVDAVLSPQVQPEGETVTPGPFPSSTPSPTTTSVNRVAAPPPSAPSTSTPTRTAVTQTTPTVTATPTRSPMPTTVPPTSSPPVTSLPLAPTPAAPTLNGATPVGGTIVLTWSYPGQLGLDEYFDVRVWRDGQPATGIANVRETSFVIGGKFPGGTYNWTIAVIRKQGGQIVTLSVSPMILHFTWTPTTS